MPHIRAASASLIPQKYGSDYAELLRELNDGLSGVVRGQLAICLVNGVLSFIGFLIFIPKYAFVMAMLAGVMSLIPIFGTIISSIPVVLVGLTVSFGTGVAVFLWILGIHFIEGNFLNPKIIGTAAKINPVIVIFVLIAGEHGFGIPGALLAVPVASVVLTLMGFTYRRIRPNLFS
jgi:predicted PurR-regulated permease PerM